MFKLSITINHLCSHMIFLLAVMKLWLLSVVSESKFLFYTNSVVIVLVGLTGWSQIWSSALE